MGAVSRELLEALRRELGHGHGHGHGHGLGLGAPSKIEDAALALEWRELDALLPDHGMPRGVIELTAPRALGGMTCIALATVRAAQRREARAWCAWIDPEATLYGPGLVQSGVDLRRLFVVRPPRADLARVAVKLASAHAFDVIVVDIDAVHGARARAGAAPALATPPLATTVKPSRETGKGRAHSKTRRPWPPEVLVRKLALLAAEAGTSILLLTDSTLPRAMPWPVALRLELTRRADAIAVRVAKDRRGRMGVAKTWVPVAEPVFEERGAS
jgi:recA bacterial DNA recombination protein